MALEAARVAELRELLGRVAIAFDQEAIYLSVQGVVSFVPPAPDGEGLSDD